jgi:CspA family cold shock protein
LGQGIINRLAGRGFGFIKDGSGRDLFFHSTALVDLSFESLHKGESVEFDRERDPQGRGDRAVNVRRIDIASQ